MAETGLIIGTYRLYLAPVGGSYVDLGFTTGGVTINQSNQYFEVRNDQTTTLQGKPRTQQDWSISTAMRSNTLDKLRAYWGIKEGLDGTSLCFSADEACTVNEEFSLIVAGPGPGCGCRNFSFPRVIITPDSVDYVINRETPVELTMQFMALADETSGVIGCVTDVCDQISDGTSESEYTTVTSALPDYSAE